jgi:hypothetical protein
LSELKVRVGANEADLQNIPDLIRTEFRLTNGQIARLTHDVAQLRELSTRMDALQRVIAEMLTERDRKG